MKIILLIKFLAITLLASAQTENKVLLYGFKEPIIKGISPGKIIDEKGNETGNVQEASFNYFIYVESSSRVYPVEMWIEGKRYWVSMEKMTTPVTRKNHNNPTAPSQTELVPLTANAVYLLKPVKALENKSLDEAKELAVHNELVLAYKQSGKIYYKTLGKLTLLEPASMQ